MSIMGFSKANPPNHVLADLKVYILDHKLASHIGRTSPHEINLKPRSKVMCHETVAIAS